MDELGRLARKVAAGDLRAAIRAVALIRGRRGPDARHPWRFRDLLADIARVADANMYDRSGSMRAAVMRLLNDDEVFAPPPQWAAEFGWDWAPPDEVLELVDCDEARDTSWRNDVSPTFSKVGGRWGADGDEGRLALWSDHPDPKRREFDVRRFRLSVLPASGDGSELIPWPGTDDVVEAVRAFRDAAARIDEGWDPLRRS